MKTRVALALLSLALLGAYVHAQFGQEAAKLDLVKVKDDLFVIHNDFVPGNTTALITNEGVVIVDDKFEIDHDNIMAQLKKVTSQPVKYVINTHYHGDHSGGNAKLQALNAQVVASEAARQKMVETKMPGLPNVTLENRLRLYVGGKSIEVHYLGTLAHQRRRRGRCSPIIACWQWETCSRSATPRRSSSTTRAVGARSNGRRPLRARCSSSSTPSCRGMAR